MRPCLDPYWALSSVDATPEYLPFPPPSDAVAKGATVVNGGQRGGEIAGALMRPAVVYPVTDDMRLYHEEVHAGRASPCCARGVAPSACVLRPALDASTTT